MGSSETEPFQDLFQREAVMDHDFTEDGSQGAGAERIVVGDREGMFAASLSGEAAVRADLPGKLVAESPAKRLFQLRGGEIARQLHTVASNSSMTRCRRMSAGALPSSK